MAQFIGQWFQVPGVGCPEIEVLSADTESASGGTPETFCFRQHIFSKKGLSA
jgi:hypothetical protein